MSTTDLWLIVGLPILANAVFTGTLAVVLTANFNARFSDVNAVSRDLRADMIERFRALEKLMDDRLLNYLRSYADSVQSNYEAPTPASGPGGFAAVPPDSVRQPPADACEHHGLPTGHYWVWYEGSWIIGAWDGEDWNLANGVLTTSRHVIRGPRISNPPPAVANANPEKKRNV